VIGSVAIQPAGASASPTRPLIVANTTLLISSMPWQNTSIATRRFMGPHPSGPAAHRRGVGTQHACYLPIVLAHVPLFFLAAHATGWALRALAAGFTVFVFAGSRSWTR
jgi:hypothetical protein